MSNEQLVRDMGQVADGLVYYVHHRHEPGCHALLEALDTQQLHALAVALADKVPPPSARPDDGIVDEVAVDRFIDGERVSLTSTERDAVVPAMLNRGHTLTQAAAALRVSYSTARQIRDRLQREEVAA